LSTLSAVLFSCSKASLALIKSVFKPKLRGRLIESEA
jgi:hypothetical protein